MAEGWGKGTIVDKEVLGTVTLIAAEPCGRLTVLLDTTVTSLHHRCSQPFGPRQQEAGRGVWLSSLGKGNGGDGALHFPWYSFVEVHD